MNEQLVDRLARALLYEGYVLYPYRRSVKTQQRWTFGGVYPPGGEEPSVMRTQCLLSGAGDATLSVTVRFLHLLERTGDGEPWQEAVERNIELPKISLGRLLAATLTQSFSFQANHEESGGVMRDQSALEGVIEVSAVEVSEKFSAIARSEFSPSLGTPGEGRGGGLLRQTADDPHPNPPPEYKGRGNWDGRGERLVRITVNIRNQTPREAGDALLSSLISTHTILHAANAGFVSLTDPPACYEGQAADCRNVGTWPVLVGADGQTDTLLSSPIILPDYPQLAAESPGDLFDGTEIDEILTLRILTLTEEEKRAAAATDDRVRRLLERTESIARDQLGALHGAMRSVRIVPVLPRVGDRVRITPRRQGEAMDIALTGRTAVVVSVEHDFENKTHVAVTIDDDPGSDLGKTGMPGHRFFFSPDEVEVVAA